MNALTKWVKTRKTTATALVIAVFAGVPLTIAALHPGFPISNVDLTSRDVWVTNGQQLLGGRLNRQIDELNGSVVASSPKFDVLQDGDSLFMVDPDAGRVEAVSPASTEVTSAIDIPHGAEVGYGGSVIAIMSTVGDLWAIPSVGDLKFNYVSSPPVLKLGAGAHMVVTREGTVIAVSPTKHKLYRIASLADAPESKDFPAVGAFQLAAVGEQAVVFDQSTNEIVTEGGSKYGIGSEKGLKLQQTGPDSRYAIVATADSLVRVDLGSGVAQAAAAGFTSTSSDVDAVAAPVNQEGCANGAWSSNQRYLLDCEGKKAVGQDITEPTTGSFLTFRVNRTVIALNDLSNGNVWLPSENMRLVDNWDDVTPPEKKDSEETGKEKSSIQSFEDTLAQRTDTNRPPTAVDDTFGIRPGRTTILSVLDNDSDPDGDVLVISAHDAIADTTGHLDLIDGGRALQFTPAPDFVGTINFNYTVDDGRGGTASANVSAHVVPEGINNPPISLRKPGVSVEANQTVSYNVLSDWRDPDGDDLYLVGASPKSGDLVRFTPDGLITFTHQTSELGPKDVQFLVSDGNGPPVAGILTVDVQPAGSLNPVGTPDFATVFVNDTVVVNPLTNDISPSGAQLKLMGLGDPGKGAAASFNSDRGAITFSASDPGVYYMEYTLQGGANTSIGIVRVDVLERPTDANLPPIAVKDTAYMRSDEPVTVSVLSNDVSPTGKILAVQSISVPPELTAKGLVVELLESTLVRITAPAALTEQVNFTYTISDGTSTATAGVTVVPVPALTKHQPPVAENDTATVRVGDIITLNVLANDFHPDDSPMFLDTTLVTPPEAGLAFVSKNELRFQAPTVAGEYHVGYRVLDPFGETAAATATFTVTALDEKTNRDPVPGPLIARVLAGGSIRVDIPLQGIDPDGDSTQLLKFPTNPTLGSIAEQGSDYFIYNASPDAAGTDVFSYQVYDAFGATGQASIKIAVIPKPKQLLPPTAVPDSVSIRPGRIAQVDLLANDSDPQGSPIKVSKDLVDVPAGVDAQVVKGQYLIVTAPQTVQSFSLRYQLTNDVGGSVMSYVLVQVTPDAPLLPPTANDIPITTKDIAGKKNYTVDVFNGFAFNPSGKNEDLAVTVEGPNAGAATLLAQNGKIEVTPGASRQAIAYRVTNAKDKLSAMAFILVPAAVTDSFDDPPTIDQNLPPQYVSMNSTRTWKLSDIVHVPSGRSAHIYDKSTVSGVQSNGDSSYVDEQTITYTPPKDYRGAAGINFTVSDGDSKDDPKGNSASLTLPIIVGDPDFKDTPPTFTTPNVNLEVGETTTIDLRSSTGHPNPQILQQVTYSDITASNKNLTANLNGSQLALSVPRDTPKGTTYTVGVTLRWDKFTIPGTINVTIVGSTRPLAVAVTDVAESKRPVGTYTFDPLTNDSNPYQTTGEPLKIVDAQITNVGNVGTVTFTGTQVKITPNATPRAMEIDVTYTIEDSTNDPDRKVNGSIRFTVTDVPDQTPKPAISGPIGDDHAATITLTAPATNGKPITSYIIQSSPAVGSYPTNCTDGAPCTISGLTNGTPYTFQASAVNENGVGAPSIASDSITPYGTPSTPVVTLTTKDGWGPGGVINASWPAVSGTGGSTTYTWTATNGASGSTAGFTTGDISGLAGGSYTVSVTATNTGGKFSPTGTSNAGTIVTQTVPPAPGKPAISCTSCGNATASITWTWGGVTATPNGGTADLTYEVSVNGGGWTNVGATTTYTRSAAAGTYTLAVRATNKSGPSGASPVSDTGTVVDPPLVPTVNYCRWPAGTVGGTNSGTVKHDGVVVTNYPAGRHNVWTTEAHNAYNVPSNGSFGLSSYHASGSLDIYIDGTSYGPFDVGSSPPC